MKELSIEEKARAYDEALEKAKKLQKTCDSQAVVGWCEHIFPELKENEDEKISKVLIDYFKRYKEQEECGIKTFFGIPTDDILAWLEKQKQDDLTNYKKTLSNYDEAEKEKCDFVGDGFIKCYADFQDFKEGETYWFEYIGDDKYNVRSDNLLGKTYHITPCQLYTIFKKQTWLEKQGEQKSFDYECANIQQRDFAPDTVGYKEERLTSLERKVKDFLFDFHIKATDGLSFDGTMTIVHNLIALCKQEHKPDWSEEDERNLQGVIDEIEANKNNAPDYDLATYDRFLSWLNSLKQKIGG